MVSIDFDVSLIIQLVNFLLLVFALNYFLYRPIRKILAERRHLIDELKNKAAAAKADLEKGEAEKARLTAEALREGLDAKNDLTAKSLEEEKKLLADAQKQASSDINESRLRLQQSAAAARETLRLEIRTIAGEMAGKILGRKI
jgi:F-type H+-transporting ATPase subunit b